MSDGDVSKQKPAKVKPTPTQVLAAFVRRGRRVALHPIALDQNELRILAELSYHAAKDLPDGRMMFIRHLPEEPSFESFVARLRPFTVVNDDLHYGKVLDAIDSLTSGGPIAIAEKTTDIRTRWQQAVERSSQTRAYKVLVEDGGQSDLELAYAWLYQDSVHGDIKHQLPGLGIEDRYEAAVSVFSAIGLMVCETLDHVNELASEQHLTIPAGSFYEPVVVTETVIRHKLEVSTDPEGTPLPETLAEDQDAAYEEVDSAYFRRLPLEPDGSRGINPP